MTRRDTAAKILCLAGGLLTVSGAHAQRGGVGNWTAPGNDPGHSGWQHAETTLTVETVPSQFKMLWKLKLGTGGEMSRGFTEPLLAPRLINSHGFKDFVYVASPDTLYAVDSELGTLLWKKQYTAKRGPGACGEAPLGIAMEPPVVINFGARRAPGAPPPPPPPKPAERRLGGSAGGGGFTLRGIFVLTADGMLHEQVLTTGADYAAPVKFLPAADGTSRNLNIVGKTVYTVTEQGCGGAKNALWSLDMSKEAYPVKSYATGKVLDVMGPAAEAGEVFLVTGEGSGGDEHANSVVAVSGESMTASDWYTPGGKLAKISPVAFAYKGKRMVAAPGAGGTIVLLDATSLGGADHKTALAESGKVFGESAETWGGLSTWADEQGTTFVYVAVADGAHGKVAAFRIEDQDGKLALAPAWKLEDLVNPAPAVIGNGVLATLAEGDAKTHAKLLVLDATTGKQLFSSGETIPTYAHMAGLSMGDGHVFFTTQDDTLYSFGIGIEH